MNKTVDSVNQPNQRFNEQGELFDSDHKRQKIRYLKALPPERPAAGSGPGNERPTVRRSFDSNAEEIAAAAAGNPQNIRGYISSDENIEKPIKRRPLVGNFSAVRAARVLHQHAIDFWGEAGVIPYVVGQARPDPSSNDASQTYQDFLLFSYLPKPMQPTRQEFLNLITPSKAVVTIQDRLTSMGIETPRVLIDAEANDDTPLISAAPPFAENLGSFCRNGVFAQQPFVTR